MRAYYLVREGCSSLPAPTSLRYCRRPTSTSTGFRKLGNTPLRGVHRRLYRFSPSDYREIEAIWGGGESALPGDPPGELVVLDGPPKGGKIHDLTGTASAFTSDYAPEEMFEIATKLYKKAKNL